MIRIVSTSATALALSAALAVPPAAAGGGEDMREGLDLLGQGTRLLLRGLMNEMDPALKEIEQVLRNLDAYHAPEILPNGDIIIRRKVPLVPGEEIDL